MEGSKEAMKVEKFLHMNAGDGESSYANNSAIQKSVIMDALPVLEETIKDIYTDDFPKCFKVADLGCSSGPNTLLVISQIMDIVHCLSKQNGHKAPEFQVSLNDLPENDFNTIFKSLPAFYANLMKEKGDRFGPCFVSGVPGSFYSRLFPSKNLHLVYSSYGVHWLSQVPEKLENNKGKIFISKSSPPGVHEAYLKQFQKDFSTFLQLRSEEIIPNGRMVLTFGTRSAADPTTDDSSFTWDLLAKSLLDMAAEGLVKEADIDSFNLPHYPPYKDEVKAIIEEEGSFTLDRIEVLEFDWEPGEASGDSYDDGKKWAKAIRAVTESMLAIHFGNSVIDSLFERYAKYVTEYFTKEKTVFYDAVISLRKK